MNIACCVQSKRNVINSASSNTYVSVCIYVTYQSHCNVNVKYTGIYWNLLYNTKPNDITMWACKFFSANFKIIDVHKSVSLHKTRWLF